MVFSDRLVQMYSPALVNRIDEVIRPGLDEFNYAPLPKQSTEQTADTRNEYLPAGFDASVMSSAWYPEPLGPHQRRYSLMTPMVVLTYVNADYADVFTNWIHHLNKTGLDRGVLALTHDPHLHQHLPSPSSSPLYQIQVLPGRNESGLKEIWRTRWMAAERALRLGLDVVLSDVDAVWIKSITGLRVKAVEMGVDILSSRGRFPPELHQHWNGTRTHTVL